MRNNTLAKGISALVRKKQAAETKLQNAGARMRANAAKFAATVKKTGIHPMNDKGIYSRGKKK